MLVYTALFSFSPSPPSLSFFSFLNHEQSPGDSKVLAAKLNYRDEFKSWFPLDLVAYHNVKDAIGTIINRVNELTANPGMAVL